MRRRLSFLALAMALPVLAAEDPVVITIHPQSANAYVGQDASFTVTATGTEPLAYQWTLSVGNYSENANPAYLTMVRVKITP